MDQKTNQLANTEDKGDDVVRQYVSQLENNIEHLKEQCVILSTQKQLAQTKIKRLELQVAYLQTLLLQQDKTI